MTGAYLNDEVVVKEAQRRISIPTDKISPERFVLSGASFSWGRPLEAVCPTSHEKFRQTQKGPQKFR